MAAIFTVTVLNYPWVCRNQANVYFDQGNFRTKTTQFRKAWELLFPYVYHIVLHQRVHSIVRDPRLYVFTVVVLIILECIIINQLYILIRATLRQKLHTFENLESWPFHPYIALHRIIQSTELTYTQRSKNSQWKFWTILECFITNQSHILIRATLRQKLHSLKNLGTWSYHHYIPLHQAR